MNHISKEKLWELLLQLRHKIKEHSGNITSAFIVYVNLDFTISINDFPGIPQHAKAIAFSKNLMVASSDLAFFLLDENYNTTLQNNHWLDSQEIDFLQLYLPLCFGAARAFHLKRTIAALHLAQTLDGRIATETGHSKWIGNQDNLIHAHRMRALCDGILIGTKTLQHDKPALSVRHVSGPTPIKIVVGNSSCNFESLLENEGKVYFFTSIQREDIKGIECIHIPGSTAIIPPTLMLEELFQRKIYTIYIEGGAITASTFLKDKAVDILQLFLAPKIFGSGICNFVLPSISNVDESVKFNHGSFKPMGDGILFEGEVCYQK
jgi:diaminohydroxyphosphoribosylaminopyrimidine deaminase / 5-amino-6-(5-phosphoribosylamino)uracil reductase